MLDERSVTQAEAAKILRVTQPKISVLRHYKLAGFTVERLTVRPAQSVRPAYDTPIQLVTSLFRRGGLDVYRIGTPGEVSAGARARSGTHRNDLLKACRHSAGPVEQARDEPGVLIFVYNIVRYANARRAMRNIRQELT